METCVVLYDGVSAFEAAGALAALHAAERSVVAIGGEALVRSREGPRIVPERLGWDHVEKADAVLVPGGEVASALREADLVRALRARRGRWSLFSGEGVRLAHAAGLLEGRRVARAPGEPDLAGATASSARVAVDGRVLTSHAGDAAVDLALQLVQMLDGHEAAARAAARLGREHRPFAFGQTGEMDAGR